MRMSMMSTEMWLIWKKMRVNKFGQPMCLKPHYGNWQISKRSPFANHLSAGCFDDVIGCPPFGGKWSKS